MRRFYAEERQAIQKEDERLRDCPPIEEIVTTDIQGFQTTFNWRVNHDASDLNDRHQRTMKFNPD